MADSSRGRRCYPASQIVGQRIVPSCWPWRCSLVGCDRPCRSSNARARGSTARCIVNDGDGEVDVKPWRNETAQSALSLQHQAHIGAIILLRLHRSRLPGRRTIWCWRHVAQIPSTIGPPGNSSHTTCQPPKKQSCFWKVRSNRQPRLGNVLVGRKSCRPNQRHARNLEAAPRL